jgi:hypothetical protein
VVAAGRLSGKVALVTGAGVAIGQGCAVPFELRALRAGRDPGFTDPLEHAPRDLTRTLVRDGGRLDDRRYEKARAALGERTLFELSTLVGYYGTLALQLRLFAVPEPRDEQRAFAGRPGQEDRPATAPLASWCSRRS